MDRYGLYSTSWYLFEMLGDSFADAIHKLAFLTKWMFSAEELVLTLPT